jgi:hypothetical protein
LGRTLRKNILKMNFAADCMWDILATNYNRGFFPGVKAGRV